MTSIEVGKIWEEIREGETLIRIYCMKFQLKKKESRAMRIYQGIC